jgi:PX domain-containing protein kinase-like protein
VDVQTDQSKVAVITQFSDEGSVRDFIFHAKPTTSFDLKYQNQLMKPQPFSRSEIAKYGKQILEAIMFLQESGVPYTHLHSGNIIITGDTARISNIENGLLNLERQYERIFRQFWKKYPNTFEKIDLDILSFIFVIYEMSTGFILKNIKQFENIPQTVPKEIIEVYNVILKEPASKLTLLDISNLPFFAHVNIRKNDKNKLPNFDNKAKKYLTGINTGVNQLKNSSRPEGPKSYITPKAERDQRAAMAKLSVSSPPTSTPVSSPIKSPPPPAPSISSPGKTQSSVPPPPKVLSPQNVPVPPPVAPPPPSMSSPPPEEDRSSLLSSIRGFSGGLRKTVTNDRSKPVI